MTNQAQALMALASRVEKLAGPDREMDAEIHSATIGPQIRAAIGDNRFLMVWPDGCGGGRSHPYRFTALVEDAEYALPGPDWPEWQITRRYSTGYHAHAYRALADACNLAARNAQ